VKKKERTNNQIKEEMKKIMCISSISRKEKEELKKIVK